MASPTRIRLTLCKGALAQLFPHLGTQPHALHAHSLANTYAANLRQTLTAHYGIPHVEVFVRPEQTGRMQLVLDGRGVDGDTERERIWDMARRVSQYVYA
ncbi:MAG: hypothetical protein ACXU86_23065 [Archangium sp.]